MTVSVARVEGKSLATALGTLANLRIAVFAEWPYLYDGDPAYERRYLAEFAAEPGSVVVVARDGQQVVGAATASPMTGQKPEFRAPFEAHGFDTASMFYFGESVLLPQYRGLGVGHAFFDHREAAAREAGATRASFAAVVRSGKDPKLPSGHRALDDFWRGRGYMPLQGIVTHLAWKEQGNQRELDHEMQFWMREL